MLPGDSQFIAWETIKSRFIRGGRRRKKSDPPNHQRRWRHGITKHEDMFTSPKFYHITERFRRTHSQVSSTAFNIRERTIWANEAQNQSNYQHTLDLWFALRIKYKWELKIRGL